MPHHVILGGGLAGLRAIEAIREHDDSSRISLISDEPAYARDRLPAWLANQVTRQQVLTADDAYFARLKVDRYIGQPASRINTRANTVSIKGGQTLQFDELLIATGQAPIPPDFPGADLPGVHPLWTVAHVEGLLRSIGDNPEAQIVVVGGGFIALIVLNALHARGWRPHLVDAAGYILPSLLHAEAAGVMESWLTRQGITLHLGSRVLEARATADKKQVVLANGTTLDADVVILATGTRPNLGLAKAAGIATDQGILVNKRMQTHIPCIYAAGDVAQGPNIGGGGQAVHALRATALEQAEVAGANMAGHELHHVGSLRAHVLECCGLYCASLGRCFDPQERMTSHDADRPSYRQLSWMGDLFVGAIWLGPASDRELVDEGALVQDLLRPPASVAVWKEILRAHPFDIRRAHAAAPPLWPRTFTPPILSQLGESR